MPKITVLGANGMLGYAVAKYFSEQKHEVVPVTRTEFDVLRNNISQLQTFLRGSSLTINCIGIIKQIISDIPSLDVLEVNCIFPRNLAKLCSSMKVPLLHVSTDCAYSGKKGNYTESDPFDASDLYGISKIAGETGECMTLRTSLIGPENQRRRSLMEWAFSQRGKQVNGYSNHLWNGVTTLCFAECAERIFEDNLYMPGIFHLHSPNTLSKYELLWLFNEIFELNLIINRHEANPGCDRSLKSNYELSRKLLAKSIHTQLVELKQFFNL